MSFDQLGDFQETILSHFHKTKGLRQPARKVCVDDSDNNKLARENLERFC